MYGVARNAASHGALPHQHLGSLVRFLWTSLDSDYRYRQGNTTPVIDMMILFLVIAFLRLFFTHSDHFIPMLTFGLLCVVGVAFHRNVGNNDFLSSMPTSPMPTQEPAFFALFTTFRSTSSFQSHSPYSSRISSDSPGPLPLNEMEGRPKSLPLIGRYYFCGTLTKFMRMYILYSGPLLNNIQVCF